MKEIIEIVFENVNLECTVKFLIEKLAKSTLRDYQISANSAEIDLTSEKALSDSITQFEGAYYFNFSAFDLNDIPWSGIGVQIYKYDGVYDLSLDMDEIEINQKISISDLQKYSESLAEGLKADNYYCGYEPARDEDTRFFTGNQFGPIKF